MWLIFSFHIYIYSTALSIFIGFEEALVPLVPGTGASTLQKDPKYLQFPSTHVFKIMIVIDGQM
jgi:hypothetical protein